LHARLFEQQLHRQHIGGGAGHGDHVGAQRRPARRRFPCRWRALRRCRRTV
jgi:hypothetical protein